MKKNKKDKLRVTSLRLSAEAQRQLDELVQVWGENASTCLRRAIALAHAGAKIDVEVEVKKE